jgi:hypothetical protein
MWEQRRELPYGDTGAGAYRESPMSGDAVTVGTIIGALIGVISLLLRLLVVTKNQHIKSIEDTLASVRAERDLFRDLVLTQRRERD